MSVSLYFNTKPKKSKSFNVHQLVMLAFVGPPPEKYAIDHIDCDKTNNRLTNLEYVTHAENNRRAEHNNCRQHPTGLGSCNAKLTARQVRMIRRVWPYKKHGTCAKLARRFNVTPCVVLKVGRGTTYRELE
jgi:hypothetical protein